MPQKSTERLTHALAPVIERLEQRTLLAGDPNVALNSDLFLFNDIRGDSKIGSIQTLRIRNTGQETLQIPAGGLQITGTGASQFSLVNAPTVPLAIAAGGLLDLQIGMNASSTGLKIATLNLKSNDPDSADIAISLRGLGTTGTGGTNEPSLQRVLDLYQIPVNVGDSNPDSTVLYNALEPLGPSDEVGLQRLIKAGPGEISIELLSVFGVGTTPVTRFGFYDAGSPDGRTELLTVSAGDAQTVNPNAIGQTNFDLAESFGLYTTWPNFKDAAGTNTRTAYSEDSFNQWDATNQRKYRFYSMKNPDGSVVANAYVVAVEEYDQASATANNQTAAAYDSNDIVFIIRNVKAAPAGPEIGVANPDSVPFHDRIVFNYIRTKNTQIVVGTDANGKPIYASDTDKRTGSVLIRNTGSSALDITGLTITGPFSIVGTPPTSIAAGGSALINLQFANTGTGAIRTGTLRIDSNDPDEPSRTVDLVVLWQSESESGVEPTLQQIIATLGYGTTITKSGEAINNAGRPNPVGDEVISAYWQELYPNLPVTIRQIGAWHSQGQMPWLRWHLKSASSGGSTPFFQHYVTDGQRLLPRLKDDTTRNAEGTFNVSASTVFGFAIDQEYSDLNRNVWESDILGPNPGDVDTSQRDPNDPRGHHVRFWPAKDRAGKVIPGSYIIVQDYGPDPQRPTWQPNYDYQDNIFLVTNIRPESPAKPAGVTAGGDSNGISLDWSDNAPRNLAGYNVFRSTAATTGFARVNAATVGASAFLDATAAPGVTYYYRVTAIDTFGSESAQSDTVSAVRSADGIPPSIPSNPSAVGSATGIAIDWADNTDADIAGYDVLRSAAPGGPFVKLNASVLATSSYFDAGAPANATSYYQIAAVDIAGNRSPVATTSAFRPAAAVEPVTPTGLTANGSTAGIALGWNDNPPTDLAGYHVYRSGSSSGTFTRLTSAPITPSSYQDAAAPSGTSYYRVTAVNVDGVESAPATVNAVRPDVVAPPTPTGLTAVGSATGIALDWNNNPSNGLAGYHVYRSRSESGAFTRLTADPIGDSEYRDLDAPTGGNFYRVTAVDNQGVESIPAAANAVRPDSIAPNAPANLTANGSLSGVSLNWDSVVAADLDGYDVFRATSANGRYSKINTSRLSSPSFNDTDAPGGAVSYYYVVAADNTGNLSTGSNIASALREAPVVSAVRINAAGNAYVDLDGQTWSAPSGFTGGVEDLRPLSIAGTGDDPLFYTRRSAPEFSFARAVPDGVYTVRFYLTETFWTAPGQRVFSIAGEGNTLFSNIDLYQEVGTRNATIKTSLVNVTDGELNLSFAATVDNAILSALEILPGESGQPPAAPSGAVARAVSERMVQVRWEDNARSESGFRIERSVDGAAFSAIAVTPGQATSYVDTQVRPGVRYTYRVRSTTGQLVSGPSTTNTVTTPNGGGSTSAVSSMAAVSSAAPIELTSTLRSFSALGSTSLASSLTQSWTPDKVRTSDLNAASLDDLLD